MLIRIQSLFMAVMAFALGVAGCSTSSKEQELIHQNALLTQRIHDLEVKIDSLTKDSSKGITNVSFVSSERVNSLLNQTDLGYLRKRGLSNPVEAIKADLVRNPQLIPVDGVLGGTMHFYEDQIQVLNRKWVLAYFEDGHRAGEMLLEYSVSNNGKVSWKVLNTVVK